jgi:hypothetical protein
VCEKPRAKTDHV